MIFEFLGFIFWYLLLLFCFVSGGVVVCCWHVCVCVHTCEHVKPVCVYICMLAFTCTNMHRCRRESQRQHPLSHYNSNGLLKVTTIQFTELNLKRHWKNPLRANIKTNERVYVSFLYLFNFMCIFECLHVGMCTMCIPGAYRGQRGYWIPGNWTYRWM